MAAGAGAVGLVNDDRLLTTRAVADYLGVSPETVLRRYRAGDLPGIRLGSNVLRFRESELEAWLAGCATVRHVLDSALATDRTEA